MARGRPRVPTRTKIIRHTFRKDRAAKNEPQPEVLVKVPGPPRGLPRAGRRMWKRQAAELVTLGVLTTADLEAFEIGCLHYGMAAELHHDITHVVDPDTGKGRRRTLAEYVNELQAPHLVDGVLVQKANVYEKLAVLYAMRALHSSALKVFTDFGLTPSARSRLDLPSPESPVKRMMNA